MFIWKCKSDNLVVRGFCRWIMYLANVLIYLYITSLNFANGGISSPRFRPKVVKTQRNGHHGSNINHRLLRRLVRRSKSYCGTLSMSGVVGCCDGRDDECSLPIYDTRCYCDEFCHRMNSNDCCPDYDFSCFNDHGQFVAGKPTEYATSPLKMTTTPTKTQNIVSTTSSQKSTSNFLFSTKTSTTTHASNHDDDQQLYKVCYQDGEGYLLGDVIMNNCNKCTCKKVDNNGYYNFECETNTCLIIPNMISAVNAGSYGWLASNYSFLWGLTLNEGMENKLGTRQSSQQVRNMPGLYVEDVNDLPKSFDARDKWKNSILPPRDQGNCGSSWAFSTTSVASDRISIQTCGKVTVELSPQHLISCMYNVKGGCHGDQVDAAWWYLRRRGVSSEECYPYSSGNEKKTPVCSKGFLCEEKIKYKTGPAYRISEDQTQIKYEIYNNGPVQAVFRVNQDLFLYKSGVYTPLPFSQMTKGSNFHAVKIIGWGSTAGPFGSPVDYWIVQNSWGEKWGEGGYFRIERGKNVAEIESMILAAWAKVDKK